MLLWTIQDERVMNDIDVQGTYIVDPKNAAPAYFKNDDGTLDQGFLIAYGWISNQLSKKSPRPERIRYPIWAWKKYDVNHDKPDMRSWTTNELEKVVRLTLEVPDDEVLLSDFDLWHIPLNLGYCAYSEQEDTEFDAWLEENGIDPYKRMIWDFNISTREVIEARKRIFKSWEKIFDFNQNHWDPKWAGNIKCDPIQAVFWQIKREYVKKVEHFITRKAKRY